MKNKGITLIALVIIIIVLLILAGVTIATLTGDNGVLTKAQNATDLTKRKTAEEEIQIEILGSLDNGADVSLEKLNDNLRNNLTGVKYKGELLSEKNKIETLPAVVEYNNYEILISGDTSVSLEDALEPGEEAKETQKYNYTDGVDVATIPEGFAVSEKKDEQKIANGLVIKNVKDGNEFVWIPCTITQYKNAKNAVTKNNWITDEKYKTNGGGNGNAWGNDYTSTDLEKINEKYVNATNVITGITSEWENNQTGVAEASINKYGGFYIARYEAGVPKNADFYIPKDDGDLAYDYSNRGLTDSDGLNKIKSLAPVSKKGVQAWNFISQPNSKIVAENMYKNDGDSVESYLVDSQAWNHICENIYGSNTSNKNITGSTNWGNYRDNNNTIWSNVNGLWTNHVKAIATYYQNGNIDVTPGGENYIEVGTGICDDFKNYNIYDMAGNMWEWTTEHCVKDEEMFAVCRGRQLL